MSTRTMLSSTPHGVKRRGDTSIDSEQRLSKRFDLLNLQHNGKLWVPTRAAKQSIPPPAKRPSSDPPARSPHLVDNDSMQVDDTRDRVYIHNLDEELAGLDTDSEEERLVFLPDIERKLAKIPKHVLTGGDPPTQLHGNEMVLYSVPTSLSVPVEKDSVRKAIIESRARAREDQQNHGLSRDALLHDNEIHEPTTMEDSASRSTSMAMESEEDPDAMDIG